MYLCIDMRSFFASVECSLRGLNPLEVPLAVVDASRGDGALIMAASPKLKEYGVPSRCRLFEISKDIFFIKAKPRMKYYILYAKKIHEIFIRYVSPRDCFTYSIDEAFLKVDDYLSFYEGNPKTMALKIMEDIKNELGIYSTCGAGDNMYLSKIALDILAKKNHGYYYLTESLFKKKLWDHKPITDFWRIAGGIGSHLARLHLYTQRDIAECNPYLLKEEFGIIGMELYEHSWGRDSAELCDIKNYEPKSKSLSRSQILFSDYKKDEALIPLLEMTYMLTLDMVRKNVDAKGLSFFAGYSKDTGGGISKSITFSYRMRDYRIISSLIKILYQECVLNLPIRSVGIAFTDVRYAECRQLNLFYQEDAKYLNLSKAVAQIHEEYGKNSVIPGMSLMEKSTLRYRNTCIGGHNGE